MYNCNRCSRIYLILIVILFSSVSVVAAGPPAMEPVPAGTPPHADPPDSETASVWSGDRWNITPRGRWAYGPCQTLAVKGGIAVAANGAYLQIWDLRNPLFPSLLGQVALPSNIEGVDWDGVYAYVADRNAGLQIVDTSDPADPTIYSSIPDDFCAYDVEYRGGYAYVAAEYAGLRIINVSNPKFPVEVGYCDTPGRALGVGLPVGGSGYACVADDSQGLRVINISNPAAPTEAGFYDTPGYAIDVFVLNEIAYVADYTQGMIALDVSTPATPLLYGSYYTSGHYVWDVHVSGTTAYCSTNNNGLEVVNVSSGGTFPLLSSYDPGSAMYDIVLDGTIIYAACDDDGIRMMDISGTPPSLVGSTDARSFTMGVGYANNHAYIANTRDGVIVVNVSDPDNPTQVGLYVTTDQAQDVTIDGKTAYVSDRFGGLILLDVSTPATPTFIGSYNSPGYAYSVSLGGGYAYLADGPQGLRIIDIGIPAAPVEVGYFNTAGEASDVLVRGDYAYVADGPEGLRVIDINPPGSAYEAGSYVPSSGWANALDIVSDHLFLANGYRGLVVLDISDPTSPSLVTELTGGWNSAIDLEIEGNYLYVSDRQLGMKVFYIIDPSNPLFVGSFENGDWIEAADVYGTRIYMAEQHIGVSILDFIPPPTPTAIHAFDAQAAGGVVTLEWEVVSDDVIAGYRLYRRTEGAELRPVNTGALLRPDAHEYIDTGVAPGKRYEYTLAVVLEDGSEVTSHMVEVTVGAAALALDQNVPNPFNPATTISFTLPSAARATLAVFDAEGRLVRTLLDGALEGGFKQAEWNGRDNTGRQVSSGVYFYRLQSGKHVLTRKMVLLK